MNVNGDIQLASKIIGDELGTITGIAGNSGDFNFTANNDKYKEAAIAQAPSKSKETALKIVVAIGKLQELNNKLAAAMEEEKQYNNSQFKEYIKLNNQFSAHLHQADKVFQQMIRKVR